MTPLYPKRTNETRIGWLFRLYWGAAVGLLGAFLLAIVLAASAQGIRLVQAWLAAR